MKERKRMVLNEEDLDKVIGGALSGTILEGIHTPPIGSEPERSDAPAFQPGVACIRG